MPTSRSIAARLLGKEAGADKSAFQPDPGVFPNIPMKYNNALLYKWLIGNSFAFLVLYIAWLQGWVELVIVSDASYLSVAMSGIFAIFWVLSSYRIVSVNREISRFLEDQPVGIAAGYFQNLKQKSQNQGGGSPEQSMLAATLRNRMMMSIQYVNYVANLMVLLGLIGTVVGFVIAVSGLGESIAQGDSVDRVKSVLGQIVNGMGIALFTTLVGSILGGIWLAVHYQILLRAVGGLVVDIVEKAEIEIIPRIGAGGEIYSARSPSASETSMSPAPAAGGSA